VADNFEGDPYERRSIMFCEQACVILSPDDEHLGWYPEWCDDADQAAKAAGGYAVLIWADPPQVLADYRAVRPGPRRPAVLTPAVTPAESAELAATLARGQQAAFAAARRNRHRTSPAYRRWQATGQDIDGCALAVRADQRLLGQRHSQELQSEMVARHAGGEAAQ
jgi:hypothetical protein